MPPSLSSLPDLCLLAVFQCLSLLELFRTIRLVSTRWSKLLNSELNRRRSLVIVDDRTFDLSRLQLDQYGSRLIEHVKRDDGLTSWARLPHIDHRNVINRNDRYKDDDQLHNQVQPEMITTLMNNLLRITNLSVMQQFSDPSSLDQVIRLIDHCSNDLVTLKLFLDLELGSWLVAGNKITNDYGLKIEANTVKLFDSINRAVSLKHLKFELKIYLNDSTANLPPLTILSQLSSFHSGYLYRNQLHHILHQYASGNEQLQISTCYAYELDALLRIDQEFYGKFVDVKVEDLLIVGGGNEDGDLSPILLKMDHFCSRFTSLSHLSLKINKIPLTMLSRSLSHLTQLVHLSLCVFDYHGLEVGNPADQNIVPIPSVRLITLTLYIESHNSTKRLHLPEMFPNLQVLSISNYTESCYECQFNIYNGKFEIDPKIRQCALLTRRPFRSCPRLHTIEIDENDLANLSVGMSSKLITRDEL